MVNHLMRSKTTIMQRSGYNQQPTTTTHSAGPIEFNFPSLRQPTRALSTPGRFGHLLCLSTLNIDFHSNRLEASKKAGIENVNLDNAHLVQVYVIRPMLNAHSDTIGKYIIRGALVSGECMAGGRSHPGRRPVR
jgi:hypothetical protein